MSQSKGEKKLLNKMDKLTQTSERIVSGRDYLSENKSIRYLEKRLKRELVEESEQNASKVFSGVISSQFD